MLEYCHGARTPSLFCLRLCDISLVLMTQIGFVTIVEHAPALIDAYPRESHQLSIVELADCVRRSKRTELGPTCLLIEVLPRSVVDGQVDGPCRQISE